MMVGKLSFAEAYHLFQLGENRGGVVGIDAHQQQADRVRADIDGAERRPSSTIGSTSSRGYASATKRLNNGSRGCREQGANGRE